MCSSGERLLHRPPSSCPVVPAPFRRRRFCARCPKYLGKEPSLVSSVRLGNRTCPRFPGFGSKCRNVSNPCRLRCTLLTGRYLQVPIKLQARVETLQHLAASIAAGDGGSKTKILLPDDSAVFSKDVDKTLAKEAPPPPKEGFDPAMSAIGQYSKRVTFIAGKISWGAEEWATELWVQLNRVDWLSPPGRKTNERQEVEVVFELDTQTRPAWSRPTSSATFSRSKMWNPLAQEQVEQMTVFKGRYSVNKPCLFCST